MTRLRVLVGYYNFPEADRFSGALRELEIVKLLRHCGHAVTFLAERRNESKYRKGLEALGVKCVSDDGGTLGRNPDRFRKHVGGFDAAILSHDWVFRKFAPAIRAVSPKCLCILDTVDLQFVRLEREAELGLISQDEVTVKRAEEWNAIRAADEVWVVTEDERRRLGALQLFDVERVRVVPNIHETVAAPTPRCRRHGVVFLGGYKHRPNVDAIHFFMEEIEPEVRRSLPDFRFSIVGSHAPQEFGRYQRQDGLVDVLGYVEDHRAVLSKSRIGVAPLRYGAGMKGKIGEYLSCGLPCVTTSIGAEGMGLRDGVEVLIADDAASFARAVVQLHRDDALWDRLSAAGLKYIDERYSSKAIRVCLKAALRNAVPRGPVELGRDWLKERLRGGRNWLRRMGAGSAATK